MIDPNTNDAFRELIARGLIAPEPSPRTLPVGNGDRKETMARHSWLVTLPDGALAKLILGNNLAAVAARHADFSQACPDIATRQLFHASLSHTEALTESYFPGQSLEQAITNRDFPTAAIVSALTGINHALTATELTSSEAARAQEWQAWTSQLADLSVWQSAEAAYLRQTLLPALYQRLVLTASPTTRWTNGDFLPSNILLDPEGAVRLVDAEFAARTHFFAEDAVRFRVLSSACFDRPELESLLPPAPALAWHLYFWLRQFQLEAMHNSAEYLGRYKVARLGLIRSLAERTLGLSMTPWSVPALQAEHRIEDLRWSHEATRGARMSGWCHPPSGFHLRGVAVLDPAGRFLARTPMTERRDVQVYFNGDSEALYSGFNVELAASALETPVTLCARLDQGTLLPLTSIGAGDMPRTFNWNNYPEWAARHDPDPANASPPGEPSGPLFSILLPVYRTPLSLLNGCIRSVLAQIHACWELCLVDDGSGDPALTECVNGHAATDARIRIKSLPTNAGISRATNEALAMAKGDFIVLLDHDDLLRPHCLASFAAEIIRHPDRDAIYSDEDKITADGRRITPFFKPAFSPEFLRGVMYVGHALCVRTAMARSLSGFDSDYDGVQDFEFILRLSEKTRRIGHIPLILYHWRQSPASSALHGNVKGDMDQRQLAAVQAHLRRISDPRLAVALGGHRLKLGGNGSPPFKLVQAATGANPVATLLQAAHHHQEDVLVLSHGAENSLTDAALLDLVALAALPDSGCIVPLLLSGHGRVYESGRTGNRPIMRGFHPESDGCHGSLRCNREVDHVSPYWVAIRRSVLLTPGIQEQNEWIGFCRAVRNLGLYHRICASARVRFSETEPECDTHPADDPAPPVFYNPNFDPDTGDYTLAQPPHRQFPSRRTVRFSIDQPHEWNFSSGCLIVRGWCFTSDGSPIIAIQMRTGAITLSGIIGMPRPDVKAAMPEAPDNNTGFEIRGTLPAGRGALRIEAQLSDSSWHELATATVIVRGRILPLWLGGGSWIELMFFQMPAHMAYAARAIVAEKYPTTTATTVPQFSIVTPSYNHARFLAETINSVLEQPGIDCDYVVQDGASNDGSRELIESFVETGDRRPEAGELKTEIGQQEKEAQRGAGKEEKTVDDNPWTVSGSDRNRTPASSLPSPTKPRLVSWTSGPDSGQADAIVRAFAKTTGGPDDLMAWINSDDFYLPGALAFVADYFARHPDVDVVYGHRIVVNEASQEIARWFLPRHDPEVLRLNDFVPQETMFWRRRIWDKVGGLDTSFKFAMDWDLLLRFQAAGAKIVRVPYFLACFRVHAAQKTSAQMHSIGQEEITRLRERTHGRPFPPTKLETHPRLLRYLRRSAFIEFLWKLGIRAR